MNKVILHIDERDFINGKPNAPYMIVRSDMRSGKKVISAQLNNAALELYSDKIVELGVTRFSAQPSGLTDFASTIKNREKIEHITVTTTESDNDISALALFPKLRSMSIHPFPPKQDLAEVAPQLQYASVDKFTHSTLADLKHLRGLQLLSGLSKLEGPPSDCVETLFIGDLKKGKGDVLSRFKRIRTLYIRTRSSGHSFDFLATLPELENFAFDGPAAQDWHELPTSLRKVSIEKTTNANLVAAHLRHVPVLSIGFNPRSKGDEGYYRGDLLESGDPFRDIEGEVYESDIDSI